MPKNVYGAYVLIGGGTGALDAIDGADLADLDTAYVVTSSLLYTYSLDVDSAAGESSPAIVSPDDNAGDKRWILVGISSTNPLSADGTAGRILRGLRVKIDDGTVLATLKCTVINRWNGATIAETDNIPKGGAAGDFSLSATGKQLTVEANGLEGNVVYAVGFVRSNASGTAIIGSGFHATNDIQMIMFGATDGVAIDITDLVNGPKEIYFEISYITDA